MVSAGVCILVASMAVFATAQIPSLGWCPEYVPMGEFDMDLFLGKWYESERYFTLSEVASRCVVTDYAKAENGRIQVSSEVTNRLTGVKRVIGGNLELAGKGNEGKMIVKYATTPISSESTLLVLDTDYDNYAVVWSCSGIGPIHTENAWLMTRERRASNEVLQRAYGVLDKFKISRTFFVKTDQQGCALIASDINAANGITSSPSIPQPIGTEEKLEKLSTTTVPKNKNKKKTAAEQEEEPAEEERKVIPETVPEHILNTVVQKDEVSEKEKAPEQGSS